MYYIGYSIKKNTNVIQQLRMEQRCFRALFFVPRYQPVYYRPIDGWLVFYNATTLRQRQNDDQHFPKSLVYSSSYHRIAVRALIITSSV